MARPKMIKTNGITSDDIIIPQDKIDSPKKKAVELFKAQMKKEFGDESILTVNEMKDLNTSKL